MKIQKFRKFEFFFRNFRSLFDFCTSFEFKGMRPPPPKTPIPSYEPHVIITWCPNSRQVLTSAIRIFKRPLPPAKPLLFFPHPSAGVLGLAVKILSEPSFLLVENYYPDLLSLVFGSRRNLWNPKTKKKLCFLSFSLILMAKL